MGVAGSLEMGSLELDVAIIYCPLCTASEEISVKASLSESNGPVTLIDIDLAKIPFNVGARARVNCICRGLQVKQ